MNPLEIIRRLYPAIAKREERSLYDRLLKDANTRDEALDKKLRALAMRGVDPSSDRWVDVETQQHPLKIARGNLLTSIYAAPNDDVTARLMLATDPEERRHAASLLHRGIGYYNGDRGLPENGVFIEGLSSELPGGGTQMLKALESQFPGLPMYLESVNNPSTLEFYVKKGFLPQPDRSSDAIPRNLFVKPADVKVRKAGGLAALRSKA